MTSPRRFSSNSVLAAATATGGCRVVNEDDFMIVTERDAAIVVDGLGPGAGRIVCEAFSAALAPAMSAGAAPLPDADPLARAVWWAHQALLGAVAADPTMRGHGAALAAAMLSPSWIRVVHVGDCRVGRLRGETLTWLTEDHSLGAAMWRDGASPRAIAEIMETHANVITRALGATEDLALDLAYHPTAPDDLYLLCTDGLSRHVSQQRIREILLAGGLPLAKCCDLLLGAAEAAGGRDNATVVLLRARR